MKMFFPRLSKDKRMFMAECLRGCARSDCLLASDKAMLEKIARFLCDVQIEVKVEVSE